MINYTVAIPTRLQFGVGTFSSIGAEAANLGVNAFVMIDPFLKGSALETRLDLQLEKASVGATKWYDIVPNPRAETCDKAAGLARQQSCDLVIAIGGGSTIDAAKAVALVAVHGGAAWDYTTRVGHDALAPDTPGLPLLAVPTSAGTGAEITPYAVLSNPEEKQKATIKHPGCFPTVAIVDPDLHLTKPRALTASTGVDTFLHAFEGYLGTLSNSWTEAVALRSMELFAMHIRTACNDGSNLAARTGMAEACYLAGLSLASIGVGIPHALGQSLGALKDTPHGESCAACLIPTIRWTMPGGIEQFARVATIMDATLATLPIADSASKLPGQLESLFSDIGLTASFGSLGLKTGETEDLVDVAFTNYGRGISRWIKSGTSDDLKEIVRNSL